MDECTQKDVPGSSATPAEDFEYTIENDGVHIERYIGDDTEVIIPANIEGKPVVYACLGVESSLSGMYPTANNVERVSLEEGSQLVEFAAWNTTQTSDVNSWEYELDALDLSNSSALEVVFGGNDRPIELTLGASPNLREISAPVTNDLDLKPYRNIEVVKLSRSSSTVWDNPIANLELGEHPHLTNLLISGTDISELDLSGCPALTVVACSGTPIETLDLSSCAGLQALACDETSIRELDVSGCPDLTSLHAQTTPLTILILNNPKLRLLYVNDTNLNELDLSSCSELADLTCGNTNIDTLDLTHTTKLMYLDCSGCNLTKLDVSMLDNLVLLGCSDNQLTKLDVSSCPNLRYLNCKNNPIEDTSALEEWFQDGGQGEM